MSKIITLSQYLETFVPFCQRNLYESTKTVVSADRIPLHFDGPCSALVKQNLIHQWWLSTVTSFEEMMFGVVSSTNQANQHLNDILKSSLDNYPQMLQFVGDRLPFGLAQVSNCIEDHELFTSRSSMTCLTSVFFAPPSTALQWFDHIHRHRLSWWKKFTGTPTNFCTAHVKGEEPGEQVAHIQNKFPWGCQGTIERIYHRGTRPIDLLSTQTQHNLKGKDGRRVVVPHVIETVTFYETAMLTYLTEAMRDKPYKGATKLVLNVHRCLAPYKVSVTQSGSNSQLKELNRFLIKELKKHGVSVLHNADTSTSMEQQFQKYDEMGIPYCIVLNDNTLANGITGLRSRDTTLQEQIHISEVVKCVKRYVSTLSD